MIHIADYFERMETIWITIAIGAGIMMAVSAIWIVSLSTAQIAGLDTYKPLVPPAALLSFALSLTAFSHNTAYMNFVYYSFPVLGLCVEILPLIMLIAAPITGKKGAHT
ncbi:MAG: hypothetical protein ACM3XS_07975 [Bacteroidota bacterium]